MPETPASPRRLARRAGLLHLAVAVFGGPPQRWVRPSVRVERGPLASAEAVAARGVDTSSHAPLVAA